MKNKYVALLFSFLLSAPALWAQDIDLSKVQQQVQAASLAGAVLQDYYKRNDFSAPGWQRVQDFLSFVEQNQSTLEKASVMVEGTPQPLMKLFNSAFPKDQTIFWGYLGARYVFYKNKKPFPNIDFSVCSDSHCRMSLEGNFYINLDSRVENPAKLINIGLHEGAHLLNVEKGRILSEIATCTAQNRWGLPIEHKGYNNYADGVRDFRVLQQRRVSDLYKEYNECIIAPLLADQAFSITSYLKSGHSFCDIIENAFPDAACDDCVFFTDPAWLNLQELLPKVLGREILAPLQEAEKGQLRYAGSFTKEQVIDVFKEYYKAYYTSYFRISDPKERQQFIDEDMNKVLPTLTDSEYWYRLYFYKADNSVVALFSFSDSPLQVIMSDFQNAAQSEKLEKFYNIILNDYAAKEFNCYNVLPTASDLIDQMAGAHTRSVVPEGYI